MKKMARLEVIDNKVEHVFEKLVSLSWKFKAVKIVSIIFVVLFLSSCEENMWLRSEKKVRNELEGNWNRLSMTKNVIKIETWSFKDGVVVITETEMVPNNLDDGFKDLNTSDGLDTVTIDVGNFSLDTKLNNVFLRLSELEKNVVESAKQGLNAKWTIVDIDKNLLFIAADNGSAIIQREFEKK